jgi:UDPglucose 6-dehydrogenase
MKIGIVGVGFVGGAMSRSFSDKKIVHVSYDKYKEIGSINDVAKTDIAFLCLPTPFVEDRGYDKSGLYEVCDNLERLNFSGTVVLKSTVEPGTTETLNEKYSFSVVHNPEFLTARTAYEDFLNQTHIVLGLSSSDSSGGDLCAFYSEHWPDAEISMCTSCESESMKIFCNNFYAMKVMIFNEFYDLCVTSGIDYNSTLDLMLKNNWINPMHTQVPGPDGELGYGGACFIKDTNALLEHTKRKGSLNKILSATVSERNIIRKDQTNVLKNKELEKNE